MTFRHGTHGMQGMSTSGKSALKLLARPAHSCSERIAQNARLRKRGYFIRKPYPPYDTDQSCPDDAISRQFGSASLSGQLNIPLIKASASSARANGLQGVLLVRALMLVMRPMLIGTVAAHTATAGHHASTAADHVDDEQRDAHNRENILQIHDCLQGAEIRERSTTLIISSNLSVVPLSLQVFA